MNLLRAMRWWVLWVLSLFVFTPRERGEKRPKLFNQNLPHTQPSIPMKILLTIALLTIAIILPAAEPAAKVNGFYADTFLSLTTPDFKSSDYGYGLGVGYQVSKTWGADVRLTHDGLNIENNAVSTIGARWVARLPWQFLSPYTFVGASFDLRPDQWHLQPGIGVELGVSKRLKGLSVFGEAGLDANLKGRSAYQFTSGLRWRF